MPRRKKNKFKTATAVRELARERIGMPRPGRVVPDQKKRNASSEKHKPTLGKLLEERD